jgi:hypothetical protein
MLLTFLLVKLLLYADMLLNALKIAIMKCCNYMFLLDRPHIEKVIVKCLVPCDLPADWRMKKLLQLWCLFDDESRSNFHHNQMLKKRLV